MTTLFVSGTTVSSSYKWLTYDQQNQRIYGISTLSEAQAINTNRQSFFLTARDSTGEQVTVTVYIIF